MENQLRLLFLLLILSLFKTNVWSQVCSVPALPSCSNCIPLNDNSNKNLSSGTYCITTTVNNVNMSGSAVVCISGAGKISGNLNGGTVIYNGSTASDPINLGNLGGGTLRIRSSVTLNNLTAINSSSTLIIENNAKLTVSSLDVNGTLIVDRAVLYVNNALGINSNGGVCFNNGIVDVGQFRSNDQANSSKVISASARGCYVVRNSFNNFNQSLTNTTNVSICLPGNTAPNNTGSATLNYSCAGGGGCYSALPVRLVSFQAQSVGEGVRLDWTTSMEKDFDYFQVERGTDAMSFEAISPQIRSLGGLEDNRKYNWTDVDAKNGTFYYRLKQVDLDKTYTYSTIVGVVFDGENKGVLLKPNPFANELSVTLNSPVKGNYVIELYSASGKLQATATGEKTETITTQMMPTANLPAGLYFANIRLGDQHFVRKIVKP